MIQVDAIALEFNGIRLEPLMLGHADGLRAAASDGELWNIRVTSVPEPHNVEQYVLKALEMPDRIAFAVVDIASGAVMGTTSYHDILPEVGRVEIGWTWYAKSRQRSHVNTACKILLLQHAFEALGCRVVGLRTDNFNFASQRAIEALGAKKDGVLRHHQARRDGTVRDSVMYSILAAEWRDVKRHLELRLARHRP